MSHHAPQPITLDAIPTPHPLDPLTGPEIAAARAILVSAGLLGDTVRVPMLLPDEPTRAELAAWAPGAPIDRRVDATLLDTATGVATEVVVSITRGEVLRADRVPNDAPPYGQPQYLFEEYERAEAIAKASPSGAPRWSAAGSPSTSTSPSAAPLAPGYTGRADEVGRRVIRSLTFLRYDELDSPWAHPVEGLIVHIDLTANSVIRVEDVGDVPVPAGHGNYYPEVQGEARSSLKPIEIVQPEGRASP